MIRLDVGDGHVGRADDPGAGVVEPDQVLGQRVILQVAAGQRVLEVVHHAFHAEPAVALGLFLRLGDVEGAAHEPPPRAVDRVAVRLRPVLQDLPVLGQVAERGRFEPRGSAGRPRTGRRGRDRRRQRGRDRNVEARMRVRPHLQPGLVEGEPVGLRRHGLAVQQREDRRQASSIMARVW